MSVSLSSDQVAVIAALSASESDPKAGAVAIWSQLAQYGDTYAKAALAGLTNPTSFYGTVIANSNLLAGVSEDAKLLNMLKVAQGYVAIISDPTRERSPDATIVTLKPARARGISSLRSVFSERRREAP